MSDSRHDGADEQFGGQPGHPAEPARPASPDSVAMHRLHARLLRGEPQGLEELFRLVSAWLVGRISRSFPTIDDHVVWDGVTEALVAYCRDPQKYDENSDSPLAQYLATAAWRNVANLLRAERRRKNTEKNVAFDPSAGILVQEDTQPQVDRNALLLATLANAKDREVLQLWLQGEHRTAAFATLLGITHLPVNEQRREVKRVKDRLRRFLRRNVEMP